MRPSQRGIVLPWAAMSNWLCWLGLAYVVGSVPFGVLLTRAHGVNIRKVGSGNVGSTNVGRALGHHWGLLCFALDVLKGLVPVVVGGWALGFLKTHNAASTAEAGLTAAQAWQWLAVAAMTVVGHVFPVWLGFRGGKGVATALGATLGLWPMVTIPALAGAATWLLLVALFRYVSLASIVGVLAMPCYVALYGWWRGYSLGQRVPFLLMVGLMALLVVWRHRDNVVRLAAGTELRFGERKLAPPEEPQALSQNEPRP